ncbi:MAG: cysteine desulfurase [Gemmatimonadetes bacterium]|nr:cysteine desulfurase [Gemmatimonadota bacterium]
MTSVKRPVYLDYHSTTPCDPRVVEAMLPCFTETFGNSSSRGHVFGRVAEELVEDARRRIAGLLGAQASEIIFTGGATESNNLAVTGAACARREAGDGNHVVSCVTEHKSVICPLERLEDEGFEVTMLPVDERGRIDLDVLSASLTENTILVTLMFASNEIGNIHPIAEVARRAHEVGAWVHTDAVQAIGKVPVNVNDLDVDMLSLSAHKFYGPKGIGALYRRESPRRVKLKPCIIGGGHERGVRSGTHNVPGIVGLATAFELAVQEREEESRRVAALRDRLESQLIEEIEGLVVNGDHEHRLPNNLSVSIPYVDGEALLLSLDDVAVSSGSACKSETAGTSHVIKALGREEDDGRGTIRFGLGRWTTEEEIDFAVGRVSETVNHLRALSTL